MTSRCWMTIKRSSPLLCGPGDQEGNLQEYGELAPALALLAGRIKTPS